MSWSEQETLDFWKNPSNKDFLLNAQPLDKLLGIGVDESVPDETVPTLTFHKLFGKNRNVVPQQYQKYRVMEVDEQDLKKYPYQSVGKLFLWDPVDKNPGWLSAFYIGNSMIMTAAHAFDNVNSHAGAFIPAMFDCEDVYGENEKGGKYGCYSIIRGSFHQHPRYEKYVHKTWDKATQEYVNGVSTPQYDICTIKIGQGSLHNSIEQAGVTPIRYSGDVQCNADTTWIALGYGKEDYGSKLMRAMGKFNVEESVDEKVVMNVEVEKGMSGGPWITAESLYAIADGSAAIASGCQAGARSKTSVSAHFSKKLFTQLNL